MTTHSVWVYGPLISVLVAACASPRDVPPRRDTLVVGAPLPAAAAPALANQPVAEDSLASRFRAFVGFTATSVAAELPELAMVATDGRRTGFDPATKRVLSQLPGADYSSDPGLSDDDGAPGDSASAASTPGIDSRVVDVPAHPGERYTLEVMASDPGTFMLNVHLVRPDGGTAADSSVHALSFGRGQVRRFAVRIGAGTMEVAEQR